MIDNLQKIKSISISLLKKDSEIQDGKAEYIKRISSKFVISDDYQIEEQFLENLITSMFNNISENCPKDADYVGIWVDYGEEIKENAISLSTLESIKEYSADKDINPIYEFFKLTIPYKSDS